MPEDRREALRKIQRHRKESLSIASQEYEQHHPPNSTFDAKASLRQFDASDFHDDPNNTTAGGDPLQSRTNTLKLILYDLNSAIAPREIRLLALRSALDEFDHDEELYHDQELEYRADHILLQKLCYALSIGEKEEEVGYICAAMEMVYRAGKKRLAKSFHEICECLLPLFVEIIRRPAMVEMERVVSDDEEEEEEMEEVKDEEILLRGIEPNDQFDPYAPAPSLGEDDESAESVSIPAGTGEYMDHIHKMKDMGNTDNESEKVQDTNLIPRPVDLSGGTMVEASSNPVMPTSNVQERQYTPEELYALAHQIHNMEAQQASRQQLQTTVSATMPSVSRMDTGNNSLVPVQPVLNGAPAPTGTQLVPLAPQDPNMTYQAPQAYSAAPNASQMPQPYAGSTIPQALPPNSAMVAFSADQMTQPYAGSAVPQSLPPNSAMLAPHSGQISQPHAGSHIPHAPPGQMPQPYAVSNISQALPPNSAMVAPNARQVTHPNAGLPPNSAMSVPNAGQMVVQPTQMPPNQVGPVTAPVSILSQEIVSVAPQLGDATQTDEEALRLRGGGENDSQNSEEDNGSQGVAHHFDKLYEEANKNFPSAASYDDYISETGHVSLETEGVDPHLNVDVLLDGSDITGDSESIRRLRASGGSNQMNVEEFSGQPGYDAGGTFADNYSAYINEQTAPTDNPPGYDADGNFADNYSAYMNAQAASNDGQPGYDADGNFADNYSAYMNAQAASNDAQANYNADYSEYLDKEARNFEQPMAEHEFKRNEHMDNASNPFAPNEFDIDDASNPFADMRSREGELDRSKRSQGDNSRAKDPPAQDGGHQHSRTDDTDIPTHIGDDQGSLSASLRSGLTNDFTYDPTSRKMDKKATMQDYSGTDRILFEQALEEHPNEDDYGDGVHGQPYDTGYESTDLSNNMQVNPSEDWAETSESSHSQGVYSVPTFNPENEQFQRRESELSNDSYFDESKFSESRGGNTLHVVHEEDDDHEDMAYAEENRGQEAYEDNYDDDIFQFQEPTMAKPIPTESFGTRYVAKEMACPLAVRKVLRILRYFSRVLSAMEQLAQQPGLVDALLYQMTRNPHTSDDEDEISARIDAIACLVNLACAEENKIMLVYHPGLLDAVIDIANYDPIEEAREHASIVMMNLVSAITYGATIVFVLFDI